MIDGKLRHPLMIDDRDRLAGGCGPGEANGGRRHGRSSMAASPPGAGSAPVRRDVAL